MSSASPATSSEDWSGRWNHIRKLLERPGPFAHPDFTPSPDTLGFLLESCRLLVVGAGGIGCELLKNLALLGFRHLHVIDMDTIDVSNLNRQFLFRAVDVGRSKAQAAAEFINQRVPGCCVMPHFCKIQDKDDSFYRQFHIVVCGLDSVVARRWLNGMMISLLNYEDGMVDQSSIIPMVDAGTEGFKGNVRVILPGLTACIECTLDLYPPQVTFPLCTIAHTPRLPEHCIEYVRVLLWPKDNPFGEDVPIDGDDPHHLNWIYEKATERASQYGISGVTYRLTQGVVKNIIPAVASTNAVVAAACATEVFKIATSCCNPLDNYMVFNDADGVYSYTFKADKKEDCVACGGTPHTMRFRPESKLQDVIQYLKENPEYQMQGPGITTTVSGKNKTLYIQTVSSIEEKTRPNLKKTLAELGLMDGQEMVVADITTPNSVIFHLHYEAGDMP